MTNLDQLLVLAGGSRGREADPNQIVKSESSKCYGFLCSEREHWAFDLRKQGLTFAPLAHLYACPRRFPGHLYFSPACHSSLDHIPNLLHHPQWKDETSCSSKPPSGHKSVTLLSPVGPPLLAHVCPSLSLLFTVSCLSLSARKNQKHKTLESGTQMNWWI